MKPFILLALSVAKRVDAFAAEEGPKEGEDNAYMQKFKKEHRGARKSWDLPHDFPNWRVITAYTEVTCFLLMTSKILDLQETLHYYHEPQ